MPRLHHDVAIYRSTLGAVDDYNQPSETFTLLATEPALIQAKSGVELAQLNNAGVVRGRYRVFMRQTDVAEGDHLVHNDDVFELTFVDSDAGGAGHHMELDAERVYP